MCQVLPTAYSSLYNCTLLLPIIISIIIAIIMVITIDKSTLAALWVCYMWLGFVDFA